MQFENKDPFPQTNRVKTGDKVQEIQQLRGQSYFELISELITNIVIY